MGGLVAGFGGAATGELLEQGKGQMGAWFNELQKNDSGGGKGEKFLDPGFMGKLDTLDLEQTWTDLLNDSYIKTFPIEQSTKAFNDVINVLPMLRAPRYKAFLSAMVKKQLAQGNNFDPAEMSNMSMIMMNLARGQEAYNKNYSPDQALAGVVRETQYKRAKSGGDKEELENIVGLPTEKLNDGVSSLYTKLKGKLTG